MSREDPKSAIVKNERTSEGEAHVEASLLRHDVAARSQNERRVSSRLIEDSQEG